jgi:fission process protein 1
LFQNTPGNDSYCWRKVIVAGVDTLIWQSFASVIIPGITINRLCAGSLFVLKKTTKLPKTPRKWITTAIGLVSIPFIIKPIDRLVDYAMDDTFRKYVVVKPKAEP